MAAVNEGGRTMPNVRSLNPIKYKMSENRFKEMYFHCLQYDEWKERSITDPQEEKRKAFKKRYRVVEETVRETHAKIYPWLLEAVAVEKATYKRLKELGMPCGKSIYYEARREFYKLLSEKKSIESYRKERQFGMRRRTLFLFCVHTKIMLIYC